MRPATSSLSPFGTPLHPSTPSSLSLFPKLTQIPGPRRRRHPRHRNKSHLLPRAQEPRRKSQTRRRAPRRQPVLPRFLQEPRSATVPQRVHSRGPAHPPRHRPHPRARSPGIGLRAAGWNGVATRSTFPFTFPLSYFIDITQHMTNSYHRPSSALTPGSSTPPPSSAPTPRPSSPPAGSAAPTKPPPPSPPAPSA